MKSAIKILFAAALLLPLAISCGNNGEAGDGQKTEKAEKTQKAADKKVNTNFQTASHWKPVTDIRADAVMVYGSGNTEEGGLEYFRKRVASWREKGYYVQYMTGIAWGNYADYFTGKWDGKEHFDEGQKRVDGSIIWHGPNCPYLVPTDNFLKYYTDVIIKRPLDEGVTDIFFEEPEFWSFSGYSDAFKKEWEKFYGTPWQAQDSSPEAAYLSQKLKYHLYYNAVDKASTFAKEYGRSKGLDVKCYVATHSLINYSQWRLVSPEASLASLKNIDGYIAQVWTGTSRPENYYEGVRKERTFESAYLEYGCSRSMTAPTGRTMYFLSDPIEDWPRDWADYKANYQCVFTAKVMYPDVNTYEVMPWPDRIYEGLYRVSPDSEVKDHIPADYATMVGIMVNSLQRMPITKEPIGGTQGISVLMANSLMFQGFPEFESYSDPDLSNFFGLALPFVKKGVPIKITHMENLPYKNALAEVKVLLMSYSSMKPMEQKSNEILASWVKKGGIIVYAASDRDPFQSVPEWWNTGSNKFKRPSDHLFSLMGIPEFAPDGIYAYGKGAVAVIRMDPKEFIMNAGESKYLYEKVEKLYPGKIEYKNYFLLNRGMYKMISVLDESTSDESLVLKGRFIDVYDPELSTCSSKSYAPGQRGMLIDLDCVRPSTIPCVLACAAREYDEIATDNSYRFTMKGPKNVRNVSRILLKKAPVSVMIDGVESLDNSQWDSLTSTYRLIFPNNPDGVKVEIKW